MLARPEKCVPPLMAYALAVAEWMENDELLWL